MIRSLAVLPALTLIYAAGTAQIVYVDDSATGANDGTSWPNAFVHLQDALAIVQPTQEVWVAAGTYRPDQSSSPLNPTPPVPGSRTESFVLTSGVAVYGGFLGTETTLAERAQLFDQTVLSGDLQGDDGPGFANYGDNSYHVVDASGSGATDVLDGFLVVGGNATGPALGSFDRGGGLISDGGAAAIVNCAFHRNRGAFGAAISSHADALSVVNCSFLGNRVDKSGGAVLINSGSLTTLTNCLFSGNVAAMNGGALYVTNSSKPVVQLCSFSENDALGGGGVSNQASVTGAVYRNCILWGNTDAGGQDESAQISSQASGNAVDYCCIQGLTAALGGTGNVGANPLFIDADGLDNVLGTLDDNLRLQAGSPCIDAGDNGGVPADAQDLDQDGDVLEPVPLDLDLEPRLADDPAVVDTGCGLAPLVDIGAFEGQGVPLPPLVVNVGGLSLFSGGTAVFGLDAGVAFAGRLYFLLGSTGGTQPGFPVGPAVTLPLNVNDPYFSFTLTTPNSPPLGNSFSALDAAGKAGASFTLSAGSPPVLAGTVVQHAYVVLTLPFLQPVFASNAVALTLVP